jgi:hypothetical protein
MNRGFNSGAKGLSLYLRQFQAADEQIFIFRKDQPRNLAVRVSDY